MLAKQLTACRPGAAPLACPRWLPAGCQAGAPPGATLQLVLVPGQGTSRGAAGGPQRPPYGAPCTRAAAQRCCSTACRCQQGRGAALPPTNRHKVVSYPFHRHRPPRTAWPTALAVPISRFWMLFCADSACGGRTARASLEPRSVALKADQPLIQIRLVKFGKGWWVSPRGSKLTLPAAGGWQVGMQLARGWWQRRKRGTHWAA